MTDSDHGRGSMPVELREIEIFLVLAEELHFGRTAERLYLSQSRVSQTIRSMEASLGGSLFERTSRRVQLTPLGQRWRDSLISPYEELRNAFVAARAEAAGVTGELRISLITLAAGGPRFEDTVRDFRETYPACNVIVYEADPVLVLERLRRGEIDLVAYWLPLEQPGLTVGPVLTVEERVLLVRRDHRLAERGWATIDDLADEAIVDADGILPPETTAALYPTQTPQGRRIPRRHSELRPGEVLALVAHGEVVHPSVASVTRYYTHHEVTAIPLRGLPPVRTALIAATGRRSAAVRAFLAMFDAPESRPADPPSE